MIIYVVENKANGVILDRSRAVAKGECKMADTLYNKLVRDKILEIIAATGKKSTYHIASEEEYSVILEEKLNEELDEFSITPTAEEAADILQVTYALFEHHDLNLHEIERVRVAKELERGGFRQKIILEKVISK